MAAPLEVGRLDVKVSPDTNSFRRELVRNLERLESSLRVEVEAVPDVGRFAARLRAATRGTSVRVDVDVDRNGLSRVRDAITGLSRDASRAASNNARIPSVPTDYGGLAAYAAAAAAAMALIGPALGLVSTALVSLPGLIAGVAAPIGALTLGMDGLKKAAETLKGPFDDLKASMSSTNEKLFTPVFETLGKVIPKLKTGLPAVSQGMAEIAQAFADTITSEEGLKRIQATMMNISSGLLMASPGVASFTDGILTLIEKVSTKFPQIGQWFSNLGTQFSAWVDKIAADGSLDASLNALGETVSWIVGVIADLGAKGMEFFSDPSRVYAFRDALSLVGSTISWIATIAVAAWDPLAAMLDSLTTGFIGFAGVVGGMAEKLSGLPIVGDKFKGIGDALKEAAGKAVEFKGQLDASKQAAQQLKDALNAPAPGGAGMLGSLGASATAGIKPLTVPPPNVDQFKQALNELPATMAQKGGEVQAQASQLPGQVGQALAGMSGIGNSAGSALMQGLTAGMQAGEGPLLAYVGTLAGKVAANKGPISYDKTVLVPNGQALMQGLGDGLRNGFEGVLKDVKDMAGQIADQVDGKLTRKEFKMLSDGGWQAAEAAWATQNAAVSKWAADMNIGGGAITAAIEGGLDYGKQMVGNVYNFAVGNVDDALSLKDREANKQIQARTGGGR